jgi:hypothetical protein
VSGPEPEDELDLLAAADAEPTEVVASVGELDATVVLLRDFLHRSGALRAVAVVEREGELPAVVDCARLAPVEVDLGGHVVHLPHAIELDAEAPPLDGDLRQLPPFEVDPATGEVRSMIGGLQHAVEQVTALAAALGGRNVALAQYPTLPVETPLSITARAGSGEAPVIALGDEPFELPEEAGH